jgi:uncharacterized membrane protein (DUF485 family)
MWGAVALPRGDAMTNAVPEITAETFTAVERSDEFRQLKKRHRSFVLPVALLFLVWYFAYVLLADYAHDFMATPVFGNINVGLLFGLGQFVSTFAITTWYVVYANRRLDPLASSIREEIESAATRPTNGRARRRATASSGRKADA